MAKIAHPPSEEDGASGGGRRASVRGRGNREYEQNTPGGTSAGSDLTAGEDIERRVSCIVEGVP